jgi:hypothetical protein
MEVDSCATLIADAATLVLRISGLGGKRWKRNVANGSRIGPWLQADYSVLDDVKWRSKGACLYLVTGDDSRIRYVGISRNGLKHRWRTSPAFDAETMVRLANDQLFHSQCWRHMEREAEGNARAVFEVRSIAAPELVGTLRTFRHPISALTALQDDGEAVVSAVERWLCNQRVPAWNVAMAR